MMPGDSQSKTAAIATDATVGHCQNCSVLHQSLTEYVSSFLALKQKITVSDDTIRLQQQLEELQIRLVSLEKKTADYESVQAELEEKRGALKAYEQLSEEMKILKQEKDKTEAENKKLEDQLKCVKDSTEKQSLENAKLRREKAAVENDLLTTQTSLKKSQAEAEKASIFQEENATLTNIKENLENKVRQFEDSICQQNHQISQLTKEKIILDKNINDLQVRLIKLERERCKEYRSAAAQASAPAEPKVDKEKVRLLLQSIWTCVQPEEQQSESLLHSPEFSCRQILPSSPQTKQKSNPRGMSPSASQKISKSNCYFIQTKATGTQLKPSSLTQDEVKHQLSPQRSSGKKRAGDRNNRQRAPKHKPDERSPKKTNSLEVSIDEILELFRPMLPCISPLADLDDEMESVEISDGEQDGHPEPSGDLSVPKQENPLNIASLPIHSSPMSSTLQKEENMELLDAITQDNQNISKNEDLGRNGLCAISNLNGEPEENCKKCNSEKDILPDDETTSLSSYTSDGKVLNDALPLTSEILEDSCSGNPNSSGVGSISETKKAFEETKLDQLEDVRKMDINPSLVDATADTANGGELLRGNDAVAYHGDDQPFVVSKCSESLIGADVTENDSEVEKTHEDSCQSSVDTTTFKVQESTGCVGSEMPEYTPSSNSHSMGCVSNKNLKEMMGNDNGIQLYGENSVQETGGIDCITSPFESEDHNKPESPVMKGEDDRPFSDQGHSESNSKTPSKMDVNIKKTNGKVMTEFVPLSTDFPENVAIDSKSFEKNRHSVYRQLSPTCLLPSVKLQASPTDPNTVSKETVIPNEDKLTEQAAVKELPQNSIDAGSTTTLMKDPSPGKEQDECLETCEAVHDEQRSNGVVEGKCSSMEGPTSAETPELISHVLTEMGPPLPPVLTPLRTPPKAGKSINPRHAIGKLSFPSPMNDAASPTTPVKARLLTNSQQLGSSCLNSPTPPNGVPLSPLQFGSATPKHALPVPGRLPTKATHSSPTASTSPPQENSMKILDTMYPELSARARTLSILRGNVSLSMCSSENGTLPTTSDGQISSFKSISSTSTAFTKTEARGEKRPAVSLLLPKKSKCPKLEVSSAEVTEVQVPSMSSSSKEEPALPSTLRSDQLKTVSPSLGDGETPEKDIIVNFLEKITSQCFDLLPVLQSHLYVGNQPKKPVLRDEEREVISEICKSSSSQVDDMMLAIQNKLKAEKNVLDTNCTQALCRVYTGICRQKRFWERAHILAYSILTEDFPDSAKLILFMVTTWPTILSNSSLLCQAIHAITKLKEQGLLSCLTTFLGWDKNPPCSLDQLISRTLTELRSGSKQSFTKHNRYGEDLGPEAWEQIYTLHLLCSHKKWKWTYEHILGNELWPLMNTWVMQPRGQQEPVSDVIVATVLRLIGCLCQLGLKERCVTSVVTVANVIYAFGRHGQTEGVPWEVQLAAVYCIYDLSPSSPKQALDALAGWRGETTGRVPPAVTSCINQIASICRQIKI